jgi:uncharacterized protein (DUF924 family)
MPTRHTTELAFVLTAWFPHEGYSSHWFDRSHDTMIQDVFTEILEKEIAGEYDHLADSISILARIILLGQMSFIIYGRQSEKAAAANAKAVRLVMVLMETGTDWTYPIMKRVFMIIPLIKAKMYSYCRGKIYDYMKTCLEEDSDEANMLMWLGAELAVADK